MTVRTNVNALLVGGEVRGDVGGHAWHKHALLVVAPARLLRPQLARSDI